MACSIKWFNTVFYPKYSIDRAVFYEEKVVPRISKEVVTLFTPWGPRYDYSSRGNLIEEGDKEVRTLERFREMLSMWQKHMTQQFRWIFMGADLYGTRINGLPQDSVAEYFEQLSIWISLLDLGEFRLWSELDQQAEPLRQKISSDFNHHFDSIVESKAATVAQKIGGGSHKAYLIERLAEATLMEDLFQPIKISCAAKHKDGVVDGPLPRLYIVPSKLQRPWFGG